MLLNGEIKSRPLSHIPLSPPKRGALFFIFKKFLLEVKVKLVYFPEPSPFGLIIHPLSRLSGEGERNQIKGRRNKLENGRGNKSEKERASKLEK